MKLSREQKDEVLRLCNVYATCSIRHIVCQRHDYQGPETFDGTALGRVKAKDALVAFLDSAEVCDAEQVA